ncbi:uncharacterized protein [Gossypium hirsutum]|uniref:Retrotransposon gag domain-containing protein n=1 Tax=Gossypium hirsutum TaxID=3635 RepID=A0ABM3BLI8_GOSHI|nr:uncharacterized protein LOC107961009 [Gossypium hirsutum]
MERILDDLDYIPEQKVKGVVLLLRDKAYQWLVTVKEGIQSESITWEFFKNAFLGKYVGASYVDAHRREFLNLTQGDKTVAEYGAEFLRLSHYVRGMVAIEYEHCFCFEDSFKDSLGVWIAPQREWDFAVLVEKAKIAEDVKCTKPLYSLWEMPLGQVLVSERGCFRCRSMEHRIRDCPWRPVQMQATGMGTIQSQRGMDWLVKHQANLDYASKWVVLKTIEGDKVVVIGELRDYHSNVISELRAEKLVRKGCEKYLAYVSATGNKVLSVKDIRMVKDFLDVFPEELPGLPRNREVEMAPKKLVELKAQFKSYWIDGSSPKWVSVGDTGVVREEEGWNYAHVHRLSDFDCLIEYHLGKANVVADALSRRVVIDLKAMFARLSLFDDDSLLAELQIKPSWFEQIKVKQLEDE